MSVVGIDFGNLQSIIAVARNRGIDVICNEVSNRTTPSLVSFGQKQRYLGETAKSQEMSNFKNTVGSLKRLVGRPFNDPEIAEIEAPHVNADLVDVNGSIGTKVNYLGEQRVFSASQLVAMYFTKLKETTMTELKLAPNCRPDVVISVPPWFTDNQRASVMDAAEVAGLSCLRVMNDTTASALGYGITKTDLPEDKPRNVMFVDIGHSNCSVAVVAFKKGELTVKSTVWDKDFGGRNFDQLLLDHFANEFKDKYKIDVKSNNKAIFRLRAGCERAKKVLSANSQAPLNIESIMDDKDVSSMLSRTDFEAMSAHLIERIEPTLQLALADSGLKIEEVDALEIVGGCTRIPALKERLSAFFGRDVSTTLNQDEAVARGCALQCAMLSPVFKVREFAVHDLAPHPIKFVWEPTPEKPNPADCQLEVFTRQQTVPSSKALTFYRKESFSVEARYCDMSRLSKGTPEVVGRYHVKDVKVPENEELATVKVRARINLNGILSVEGAYLVEEVKVEEKTDEDTPMETENGENAEGDKSADVKPAKKKRTVKKVEIPVESEIKFGLDPQSLATFKTMENDMAHTDKIVAATEEAKNALEEYVYDTRSKVEGLWSEFVSQEEKAQFLPALNAAENWLYDEGEDATKEVYAAKLRELKSSGDPILERYRESEERPRAENLLRDTVSSLSTAANSRADTFAHVTQEERTKVLQRCEEKINWLEEQLSKQEKLAKFNAPLVTAREILDQRESLNAYATPIIFKPKPQPKLEEKTEEKPVDVPVNPKEEQTAAPEATSEMDVD